MPADLVNGSPNEARPVRRSSQHAAYLCGFVRGR
jgi:hypothetical protein